MMKMPERRTQGGIPILGQREERVASLLVSPKGNVTRPSGLH